MHLTFLPRKNIITETH